MKDLWVGRDDVAQWGEVLYSFSHLKLSWYHHFSEWEFISFMGASIAVREIVRQNVWNRGTNIICLTSTLCATSRSHIIPKGTAFDRPGPSQKTNLCIVVPFIVPVVVKSFYGQKSPQSEPNSRPSCRMAIYNLWTVHCSVFLLVLKGQVILTKLSTIFFSQNLHIQQGKSIHIGLNRIIKFQ